MRLGLALECVDHLIDLQPIALGMLCRHCFEKVAVNRAMVRGRARKVLAKLLQYQGPTLDEPPLSVPVAHGVYFCIVDRFSCLQIGLFNGQLLHLVDFA